RDRNVTGVQTCALPISGARRRAVVGSEHAVRRDDRLTNVRTAAPQITGTEPGSIRLTVTEAARAAGSGRLLLALGGLRHLRRREIGRASCRERVWAAVA